MPQSCAILYANNDRWLQSKKICRNVLKQISKIIRYNTWNSFIFDMVPIYHAFAHAYLNMIFYGKQ